MNNFLFQDPGCRGSRSAEVQYLRRQPLDKTDIQRVLDRPPGSGPSVLLQNGKTIVLTPTEAARLLPNS